MIDDDVVERHDVLAAQASRDGAALGLGSEALVAFRAAIGALEPDLDSLDDPARADDALRVLLADPAIERVLARTPGGVLQVCDGLLAELRRFRPGSPSSASNRSALVRIYLLSQVDTIWCAALDQYQDDDAVCADDDLVDLPTLRRQGVLHFRFKLQPRGLPGRVRNRVARTVRPRRSPHTSGLSQRRARPELVALLNAVADEFRALAPPGTPPLWVTSILRTVDQQRRLRDLGYSAVLPSAHCSGLAADIEMRWFAHLGADDVLADTLRGYQSRGFVNVIDEGQAWHVCLNPRYRVDLQQQYRQMAQGS